MDVPMEEAKADRQIIRILPYLVIACTIGGALNVIFRMEGGETFGMIAVMFCEAFVAGFVLLGVFCMYRTLRSGKGLVRNKVPLFFFIIGPVAVAAAAFILGETVMPDIFMSDLFKRTDSPSFDLLRSSFLLYCVMFLIIFVVHGIESVISAHFRQYIARVYRYIGRLKNDGTDDRKGRFVLKFYDVPEIIDIKSVELEPIERDEFPMDDFVSMSVSIFALGLIICSYIFLNPMFMKEMTIYESMMIGMIISFFIPLLIIPWYVTKETGTKIKSQARDYYLWKGLKKRMYQSFFAFSMILLLVILVLYFESDMLRITYTYVGYVTFMASASLIYSYVFFNRYNMSLKEGIIKRFD